MPNFSVNIPHALSTEEAVKRLNRFAETVGSNQQVSDLEQSWQGNDLHFGFKTFGIQIRGVGAVSADQLQVTGELPFSAMMFKGKIEAEIQKVLADLLSDPSA